MDLLRELKAMPVTLHLLQVGPCVPPARDSSWAPDRASGLLTGLPGPCPGPWLAQMSVLEETVPAFVCC